MSRDSIELGLIELSAVKEITNIGLGNAMTALSSMTGRTFELTVPSVQTSALTKLPSILGCDELSVGIYMPIEGDAAGFTAFLFRWPNAQQLWQTLLGTAPESPDKVDELAASAMVEVGNIINGSFLRAIADMTNMNLLASPPMLAIDMSITILESLVTEASLSNSAALAIETEILVDRSSTSGLFVFVPTLEGLAKVFRSLGIAEAA